jgi:hypothetical protein
MPKTKKSKEVTAQLAAFRDGQRQLMEALQRDEELLPELRECVVTERGITVVRHPFVNELFTTPAVANLTFRTRLQAFTQHLKVGEIDAAFGYVAAPHRFQIFHGHFGPGADDERKISDKAYWNAVGWMFTATEFPFNDPLTIQLLTNPRPGRHHLMSAGERKALAAMPKRLTIYRGYDSKRGNPNGWSWTTDQRIAEWFAVRLSGKRSGKPCIAVGAAARDDVLAHFTGRDEAEVLIDSQHVTIRDRYEVDPATASRDRSQFTSNPK